MKRLQFLFVGFAGVVFFACNGQNSADDVVARIGTHELTRAELDFAIGSGSSSDQRSRQVTQTVLFTRIWAEAGKMAFPQKQDEMDAELQGFEDRDLSQLYLQNFLRRNLGFTDDQLDSWFRKYRKEITQDSSITDYSQVRDSVVKHMVLRHRKEAVREYFDKHKERFAGVDSVEIGILQASDSLKVAQAIVEVQSGASFESVAAKVLQDSALLARKGRLAMIGKGNIPREFLRVPSFHNWFFSPQGRIPQGSFSSVVRTTVWDGKDSVSAFIAATPLRYKDAKPPVWENNIQAAGIQYLEDYRRTIGTKVKDSLMAVGRLVRKPLPQATVEELYKQKQAELVTAKGYALLHIQGDDSAALATATSAVQSEEQFRALATRISNNPDTRKKAGEMGLVKVGHCLPWGIGMLPELFATLEGKKSGKLDRLVFSQDNKKWHAFWLLQEYPPQGKPLDRVKVALQQELLRSGDMVLDSNFVLVERSGKPVIWEKDVLALQAQIPDRQRSTYNRSRILDILSEWVILGDEARKMGVSRSREFRVLRSLREADLWARIFRDSILNHSYGYDMDLLEKTYEEGKNEQFAGRTGAFGIYDAARWLDIPDYAYQRELVLHPNRYPGVTDWKTGKKQIFPKLKDSEARSCEERLTWKYLQKMKFEVLDTNLKKNFVFDPQELFAQGLSYYESRSLPLARTSLMRVRDLMGLDTLAFRAVMLLGQTYTEQEEFLEALNYYTEAYELWPGHPDAYKALFMKGFIQAENLKQDSMALKAFQELLQRFPKCDLADDAEWMVRNIQSGGALAPALLDSIAKQDTLTTP